MISNNLVEVSKVRNILSLFFEYSKRKPNDFFELVNSITDTLEDKAFAEEAKEPASKWLDVDYEVLKKTIVDFISSL